MSLLGLDKGSLVTKRECPEGFLPDVTPKLSGRARNS